MHEIADYQGYAEAEAGEAQENAHEIEEGQGMEVPEDVSVEYAAEEAADEHGGDFEGVLHALDLRLALARQVDRPAGDVHHLQPPLVQADQEIHGIAVALPGVIPVHQLDSLQGDGGITVHHVHDLVVAGGHFGHGRDHHIGHQPQFGHILQRSIAVEEAAALGVVGLAVNQRVQEICDLFQGHLVIPADHHRDIIALGSGFFVAGDNALSHAHVRLVTDQLNPGVLPRQFLNHPPHPVGAAIIHHINPVNQCRNVFQGGPDQLFFIVSGDDQGNVLVTIHGYD